MELNLNSAAELNLKGLFAYADWPVISLEQFENDKKTPKNFTGTYKMVFSETEDFKVILFTLAEGTGLTKLNNLLTIEKPSNIIVKGPKLFYQILNQTIANKVAPVFEGVASINPSTSW